MSIYAVDFTPRNAGKSDRIALDRVFRDPAAAAELYTLREPDKIIPQIGTAEGSQIIPVLMRENSLPPWAMDEFVAFARTLSVKLYGSATVKLAAGRLSVLSAEPPAAEPGEELLRLDFISYDEIDGTIVKYARHKINATLLVDRDGRRAVSGSITVYIGDEPILGVFEINECPVMVTVKAIYILSFTGTWQERTLCLCTERMLRLSTERYLLNGILPHMWRLHIAGVAFDETTSPASLVCLITDAGVTYLFRIIGNSVTGAELAFSKRLDFDAVIIVDVLISHFDCGRRPAAIPSFAIDACARIWIHYRSVIKVYSPDFNLLDERELAHEFRRCRLYGAEGEVQLHLHVPVAE